MPRPDTIATAVEQPNDSISALGSRGKGDSSVGKRDIRDDCIPFGSGFPDQNGGGPVQALRADVRRRFSVALHRSVERVGRIEPAGDITVCRAVFIQRDGCGLKAGVEFRAGLLRTERIGRRGGEALRIAAVRIPSLEHIPRTGACRQAASLLVAQRHAPKAASRAGLAAPQGARGRDRTAGRRLYIDNVGHPVLEVAGSADPVGIPQRNAVGKAGVRRGVNRRAVLHAEEIVAVRIVNLEIRPRFAVKVVEKGLRALARHDGERPVQRQLLVVVLHVDMQQRRPLADAIVAKAVVIEVIPHLNRIGVDARVDLVVAQDRDAEGVVHIGPDVEVRGVVAAQVDRIEQVPAAVRGADQQVRGVLRSILGTLLPLVRDRRNGALKIRKQVAGTRGRRSRERRLGTVRIVGRIGRRGRIRSEERRRARKRDQLHGAKLDIGVFDVDLVGDLGHAPTDLDGRAACPGGRYIELLLGGHRKTFVTLRARDSEFLLRGIRPEVAAEVGGKAHPIMSGHDLEAKGRRLLVAMQEQFAVVVIEVEVQIVDRLLVRRAGLLLHPVGTDGDLDRHTARRHGLLGQTLPASRQCNKGCCQIEQQLLDSFHNSQCLKG